MALTTGARLGPYEILAWLGAGGMGEVYRARDTRLDRTVAIKVLPAELARDASRRQRLEREAKAISQLSHPHICTLHDVGREDETEKMGGTIHLVLGAGFTEVGGTNQSKIHLDMLADMADGVIEVDGRRVYENGQFLVPPPAN